MASLPSVTLNDCVCVSAEIPLRIQSIDAFRGTLVFFIIGYEPLMVAFRALRGNGSADAIRNFGRHARWEGFGVYDLGLPTFLLVVGISLVLSASRFRHDSKSTVGRVFRRSIGLFLTGVVLTNFRSITDADQFMLVGVLQRIAVCYLVTGLLYNLLSPRWLIAVAAVVPLSYWMIVTLVPVPGYGRGNFSFEGNAVAYIDRLFLPGRTRYYDWDPYGIMGTYAACTNCLIGALAGTLLLRPNLSEAAKARWLMAAGSICLAAGYIWSGWMPVIKAMWTSSFALLAAGWGLCMCGLYHLACQYLSGRRLLFPLVVLGANPLVAYIAESVIPVDVVFRAVCPDTIADTLSAQAPLAIAFIEIGVFWLGLYALYQRQMLIRA